MCNGVSFVTRNLSQAELEKFYTPAQLRAVKMVGEAKQYFWQQRACLPVVTKTGIQLKLWGNKTDDLALPKTAWAKIESIKAGKWEYLNPKPILLAINGGLERKVKFDMPKGASGLIVRKHGEDRVYLVTKAADEEYLAKIGGNRQPIGKIVYK